MQGSAQNDWLFGLSSAPTSVQWPTGCWELKVKRSSPFSWGEHRELGRQTQPLDSLTTIRCTERWMHEAVIDYTTTSQTELKDDGDGEKSKEKVREKLPWGFKAGRWAATKCLQDTPYKPLLDTMSYSQFCVHWIDWAWKWLGRFKIILEKNLWLWKVL